MSRFRFPLHRVAGAATVVLLAGALAACSGSTGTGLAAPGQGNASQGNAGQGGSGQGTGQADQREPGVSGKIAAKSGKTLQVQGSAGQTAVTYTAKTTFTDVATSSAKALAVGLCATARSTDDASASATATIAAGTVTLSKPTGATCDAGFGGGGFGGNNRPSGAPSGMPSGGPGGAPSGAPNGRSGRGTGASGKIISVDGGSFVVESTRPGNDGKETTTTITITSSAATTWSMVEPATAKAAMVGTCATAMGSRSSTGAMTATTLRLTDAVKGTCSTGFAGRNGGGGRASGNATPATDGVQGNG